MKQFIEKIKKKENLTFDESKSAFELLMNLSLQKEKFMPVALDISLLMENLTHVLL